MGNSTLTYHANRFFALVPKSPVQMGYLSIINKVRNISRLGTFKVSVLWMIRVRPVLYICSDMTSSENKHSRKGEDWDRDDVNNRSKDNADCRG